MTMRIWTYLTSNAAGEPTAAGTYYDPHIDPDIDVRAGRNFVNTPVRDGTKRRLRDPLTIYEDSGRLTIRSHLIDKPSETNYLGSLRYLGPVLYHHYRDQLPLCIFIQSIQSTHKKAYIIELDDCDAILESQSTTNTDEMLYLRRDSMPKFLGFPFTVMLDGLITDWALVTGVGWNTRTST